MSKRPKSDQARAFDMAVGRRIELTRSALNVRPKDLAELLGVTTNAIYAYECGAASCPLEKLAKIAAHLGVSVAALIPRPK